MTADHPSQEERLKASRNAQNIQKTINTTARRRLVRCVALKVRSREISSPDQGARYGIELRVEPISQPAGLRL